MLRWWCAGLLALSASCSASSDDTIDITFDACSPIAIAMPPDELRASSVREAFALWGLEPAPTAEGDAQIQLVFEDAAEAFHGLYDDEHAVIYINARITAAGPLAIVIAHELGHAMGLPHISAASVMRSGNTTIGPTPDDAARLHALWGECLEP